MVYTTTYESPLGTIALASDGSGLCGLWFEGQEHFGADMLDDAVAQDNALPFEAVKAWLDSYFAGERPAADELPLVFAGTEFQHTVWKRLREIPYGEKARYEQIARDIGRGSARSVGVAVAHNPISIIIPCHRVVGKNGKLTGYAGGLERKAWLLEHEGAIAGGDDNQDAQRSSSVQSDDRRSSVMHTDKQRMSEYEAMLVRHSVRRYLDKPLDVAAVHVLQDAIAEANAASGLHIQLVLDESQAFGSGLAHYGSFRKVTNYLAICGPKGAAADELAGYWGEKLVLLAKTMGIDSCWVALTFSKRAARFELAAGERLIIMVALGYAETEGHPHKSKSAEKVADAPNPVPDWFAEGVAAALLAPTALNQQRFHFTLIPARSAAELAQVKAKAGFGAPQVHIDLGIAKYHFELGAGREAFTWA